MAFLTRHNDMKTIYKTLTLSLTIANALLMTGCYSDFEPDIASTPVVCINADIRAGEKISAEVTRTWRYSEGDPNIGMTDIWLRDADVTITVNETDYKATYREYPADGFDGRPRRVFEIDCVAREGDNITIHAADKTYGEAFGSVTVPRSVPIENVTWNSRPYDGGQSSWWGEDMFSLNMKVTFTDPGSSDDYYIFGYDVDLRGGQTDGDIHESFQTYGGLDVKSEPLFSEHVDALETIVGDNEAYTFFSDRQISGKTYSLNISFPQCVYRSDDDHGTLQGKFIVEFSRISVSYYRYMLSLWATEEGIQGALGGVGLGNPVWEYSNVSTGAGIISASATSRYPIPLHRLPPQDGK